jgi:hypothetical protein
MSEKIIQPKKKYIYSPEKIREYNKRMYEKKKDEEPFECSICHGLYKYFNRSHHINTDIHQRVLKHLEQEKQKKMNPPTLDTLINSLEDIKKSNI